ncbi:hypothetical protein [Nocardia sp. R7R-8]|uniref:hypothetical protein n=1 Tax=Nocardia sp. R7R-8 TaxID=3459304 RepID=UPI00403E165C
MQRYWPWLGTTILALIAIAISLPPVLTSWPRWVLMCLGALLLLGVLLTFPWQNLRNSSSSEYRETNQSVKAGDNANVLMAGNDLKLNGNIGDRSP